MLAAVDAGSNTLRLLIGQVVDGRVLPDLYLRRICRLAGGYTVDKGLSPEAKERTLAALQEFAAACRQHGVTRTRAVGTAAFRQAVNGEAFAGEVRRATALPLDVISGEAEAQFTAQGVLSALHPLPTGSLIIDIGGGSTEFVLCQARQVLWTSSVPLGVVRLSEGHAEPSSRQQVIADLLGGLAKELAGACQAAGITPADLTLVGTAGTATTLAALDMQMAVYDWRRVNNYQLTRQRLQSWQARLAPLSPAAREALPGMEPGRGDLITVGLEIILTLMGLLAAESLTISDFGLLEGLLLSIDK